MAGCGGEPVDDTVQYAAEFFPDGEGKVKQGEPQFFLHAILLDDGGNVKVVPPPPPGEAEAYDPTSATAIAWTDNFDKSKNQWYALAPMDMSVARENPYRAYSPWKQNGKYVEAPIESGDRVWGWDRKAQKGFRVVPKDDVCWHCGGAGQIHDFARSEVCPDCDGEGFLEYYGVRRLDIQEDGSVRDRKVSRNRS